MRLSISFDDGHVSELRAAKLLQKYNLPGTFYYPTGPVAGIQKMSLKELAMIVNMGFEVGGHTISHPPDIKTMPDERLKFELRNSKKGLEVLLKTKVTKFAYPRGRHDERVRQAVKDAGYMEARTTLVLQTTNEFKDPFRTPTTIHMAPRREYDGQDWLDLAKGIWNDVVEEDDDHFFSLWGHTYELDRNSDWEKFEELLEIISESITN